MVKEISHLLRARLILSLCLCFLSASCLARDVKSVKIEATGLYEHDSDPTVPRECKTFQPTARQIKYFFSKAYPVEQYVLVHSRYSPCYAKGSIKFSDGHFGEWKLHSGGVAVLIFNRGDEVTVYYGINKWEDPFEGMYDFNGE